MNESPIVDEIRRRRQQPTVGDALELSITLAKVDRMIQTMLDDDGDPIGEEAYHVVLEIKRMINHRDLGEAKKLLRLRDKVEEVKRIFEDPEDDPEPEWLLTKILEEAR